MVQFGLIGDNFEAHIRNQMCQAANIGSLCKILTHPIAANVTKMQRIRVIDAAVDPKFMTVVTSLYMFVLPCLLFSGKPLII